MLAIEWAVLRTQDGTTQQWYLLLFTTHGTHWKLPSAQESNINEHVLIPWATRPIFLDLQLGEQPADGRAAPDTGLSPPSNGAEGEFGTNQKLLI